MRKINDWLCDTFGPLYQNVGDTHSRQIYWEGETDQVMESITRREPNPCGIRDNVQPIASLLNSHVVVEIPNQFDGRKYGSPAGEDYLMTWEEHAAVQAQIEKITAEIRHLRVMIGVDPDDP